MIRTKDAHPTTVAGSLGRKLLAILGWTLVVLGIAHVLYGSYQTWLGNLPVAAVAVAIGLVLIMFGTIDRFEAIKGLGVEAKLRKVDDKLDEADEIFLQVRQLAELTGSQLMESAVRTGYMTGPMEPEQLYELALEIKRVLERAGSPPEVCGKALEPWSKFVCQVISQRFIGDLDQELSQISNLLLDSVRDQSAPDFASRNVDVHRRLEAIAHFRTSLPEIEQQRPKAMLHWVKKMIRKAPEISEEARARILRSCDLWDEDLRIAALDGTLRDEGRAFAKMRGD